MSVPASRPLPAAADLQQVVDGWLERLAYERRYSAHTVAAYRRDVADFLHFLREHLGGPADLAALGTLSVRDFRAWLARRAAEGRAKVSTARALSVVRVLFPPSGAGGPSRIVRARPDPGTQDAARRAAPSFGGGGRGGDGRGPWRRERRRLGRSARRCRPSAALWLRSAYRRGARTRSEGRAPFRRWSPRAHRDRQGRQAAPRARASGGGPCHRRLSGRMPSYARPR